MQQNFIKLENKRINLFKTINQLDENIIYCKTSPDKWSIFQIIFHLVKSEQLTLLGLKKSLADAKKLTNAGIKSRLRYFVLRSALISRFKFKAPPIVASIPEKYDMKELELKWDKIRKDINKFIETFPPDLEGKNIFKHPLAGWLNINQTINFLHDHYDHHNRQIKTLLQLQNVSNN